RLAKRRLSAKEIAGQLYISEMTVKATLRSVYSKLGIHSKAELTTKEF
ncbi:MAG: response regulator transcription factor, partial [Clostridiales bacterium]|nr:response regulator transcription factor [Clostridiales bacterium]